MHEGVCDNCGFEGTVDNMNLCEECGFWDEARDDALSDTHN